MIGPYRFNLVPRLLCTLIEQRMVWIYDQYAIESAADMATYRNVRETSILLSKSDEVLTLLPS
jgi:hypothetical protein